ncbi:MAG: hypothetical protein LBG80_12590 [Bacteroidales bacterium]|jgi:hypothetical protein|nr:hypothetical protein [Bacteroidales bacterium]
MTNRILLVEGSDDKHVIYALCKKYRIPDNFEVIDCNGVDNLIEQIPVRFKTSEIETIGIIIDADDNLQSQWCRLKNILSTTGFAVPQTLPKTGLILEKDLQKTGVWIMPNNNANGMLEDFITFLIPPEDKLLPVVHSTLNDIEFRQLNKYSMVHKSKAVIHTWLAWQEEPGKPMGLSITKKYLSADDATCHNFIQWVNNLFEN